MNHRRIVCILTIGLLMPLLAARAQVCNSSLADNSFVNLPIDTPISGAFSIEFDVSVEAIAADFLVGFNDGPAAGFAELAAIVRFNPAGSIIDARNGTIYAADAVVNYAAGQSFHVRVVGDTGAQTYSVFVTPEGGSEVTLATDYAFRDTDAQFSNITLKSTNGVVGTACEFNIPGYGSGEGEGEGEGEGAEIIWVNSAANNDGGFATYLEGLGHTVTMVQGAMEDTSAGPDVSALNAADLVIVSLNTNSGEYDGTPAAWNGVTTPLILMSPWISRNNRWLWLNSSTVNQGLVAADATINVEDTGHPLFAGLGSSFMPYTGATSDNIGAATDVGSGTVLARIAGAAAGDDLFAVYWGGGTEFYSGSGQTPAGPRLLMVLGAADVAPQLEGTYNLSAAGETLLANAVDWLAPTSSGEGEPEPQEGIVSNVYPPYIDEGTTVVLTSEEGTGYQWAFNGVDISGATDRQYILDPITEEEAGTYSVTFNDGTGVVTDSIEITVNPEGSVPIAGGLGLAALLGATALAGAGLLRRR